MGTPCAYQEERSTISGQLKSWEADFHILHVMWPKITCDMENFLKHWDNIGWENSELKPIEISFKMPLRRILLVD